MVLFTSEQKKAVYNITMLMMMIDGHIAAAEREYWKKVGVKLSMSDAEKQAAATMDKNVAVSILRMMPPANKLAAIKIFANMMEADGKVDPRETNLLGQLVDATDAVASANILGENALKAVLREFQE